MLHCIYSNSIDQIIQNTQQQQQEPTCIMYRQKIMSEEKLSFYKMFNNKNIN